MDEDPWWPIEGERGAGMGDGSREADEERSGRAGRGNVWCFVGDMLVGDTPEGLLVPVVVVVVTTVRRVLLVGSGGRAVVGGASEGRDAMGIAAAVAIAAAFDDEDG